MSSSPHKFIDWEGIKQAYCFREDKPSYRQLADEFHLHYSYIGKVAGENNWVQIRRNYIKETENNLRNEMMKIAVNIRKKNLIIINLTIDNIYKRIESGDYTVKVSDLDKLVKLQHFLLGESDSRKELNVGSMTVDVIKEVEDMTPEEIKLLRGYLNGIILPGAENLIDLENSVSVENIKLFRKQQRKNLTANK